MAEVIQLIDGTTTVDLNDGTSHTTQSFIAPPPAIKAIRAGVPNPYRMGSDLVRQGYRNRNVTMALRLHGATRDTLATQINDVEKMLRKASEWSQHRYGAQVQLKWTPSGATNSVFFNVVTGTFNPFTLGITPEISVNEQMTGRLLALECEPLAVGTQETVENYLLDPNFEVAGTALADWSDDITATGTAARDTTEAKYGSASLKLVMTNSSGSGENVGQTQSIGDADAAEVWSFAIWAKVNALSNCKLVLDVVETNGSATYTVEITAPNSGFVQILIENKTLNSGTTAVVFKPHLESEASSATGTCFVGGCYAIQAASIPKTWISSRFVKNHYADDAQASVNNIDIHDVPGDVRAGLQIIAAENEAHTDFWAGVRHATRQYDAGIWHEGESFSGPVNIGSVVASTSDGSIGQVALGVVFDATAEGNATDQTSVTVAVTVADKPDPVMYICVTSRDTGGGDAPSSVVYDSEGATSIGTRQHGSNSTFNGDLYRKIEPNIGTANVVVTYAAEQDEIHVGVVVVYGAHQSTPNGTVHEAEGTDASWEDTVTDSADGDLLLHFGGVIANTTVLSLSETERWDTTTNAALTSAGQTGRAAGSSEAVLITMNATGAWLAFATAIKPAHPRSSTTAAAPAVITKAIATPPNGLYRVLVRVTETGTAPDIRASIGFAYGAITSTPSVAAQYTAVEGSAYHILDLGVIRVPPIRTPDNMTDATITLRVAIYDAGTGEEDSVLAIDWLMLLPVDDGAGIINKTSAQDVVLGDSLSDLHQWTMIDTSSVVQSLPQSQAGMPPEAHPEGTRIYFVSDDGAADIADGWTIKATVEPRFLSIAQA